MIDLDEIGRIARRHESWEHREPRTFAVQRQRHGRRRDRRPHPRSIRLENHQPQRTHPQRSIRPHRPTQESSVMTSQPDLRSNLHHKLNADRYTGWWPEATLDDDLNAVTLDETGLEHLYINGQRWGWVQHHDAMDIWIGNWRDFDAALDFRVQWREP